MQAAYYDPYLRLLFIVIEKEDNRWCSIKGDKNQIGKGGGQGGREG